MIVGIGASAGGLAVLKKFVQALPPDPGMAFVIIQHLDPEHKSLLSELLARGTQLTVKEAEDKERINADQIYVIPPGFYLEIVDRHFKLTSPQVDRGQRKAIDHFFRSLAENFGSHCAGIVLTGSGSDGTAGLRSIKAVGGLTMAQSPETAEHISMPKSAIDANVVDKILPVEEMLPILANFSEHPHLLEKQKISGGGRNSKNLSELSAILKTYEGFNLKQYKPSTVLRRVARRMSLTDMNDFGQYVNRLREHTEERKNLVKDLLINVTDFFRDPPAFEILEEKVIPAVIKNLDEDQDLRIWIAGCATGEEAYSMAILLLEAFETAGLSNEIKIFATDINEQSIQTARKGVYSESIAGEVPKVLLDKYFVKLGRSPVQYRIKNQVRDLISFAVQNVVTDPPFHRMHLICCRNLLIYLKKEFQEKVLSAFHFALEDGFFLFLGSSETIGKRSELFKTIHKKWRIYQKTGAHSHNQLLMEHLHRDLKAPRPRRFQKLETEKGPSTSSSRADLFRKSLLDAFLAPGVLVDPEGHILYNHGNWKPYLNITSGEPRNEITRMVLPVLSSRIRSALFKVKKTKAPLSFRCDIPVDNRPDTIRTVLVELHPIVNPALSEEELIGIIFREEAEIVSDDRSSLTRDDEQKASQNLEQELAETKEELQHTIEELETSTEELKASHEEALSTNEELQSANEELEAGAEEMRSLNEELSTVNAQLKEKIEELQKANDDVQNFFSSTNLPTIFLDPKLRIQRYTEAAEHLLKMGPQDIGRQISSIGRELVDDHLSEECMQVLQNFQPIRKETQAYDGKWYIRQITPYRTEDRRVEGVVLVFQDITEIRELSKRAEEREQQQAVVAKLGIMALSKAPLDELIQQAVRQVAHTMNVDYCKVLKYRSATQDFLLLAGVGWDAGLVGNAIIPGGQDSQAGYTLLSQDPVIVRDLSREKRFSGPKFLKDHKVVSGISCLINHSQPPYGVLGVHTSQAREFTPDDSNFLLSVANLLSTAIRNKETQNKLNVSRERLHMAREAAKIGIHDHDILTNEVKWDNVIREIWGISPDVNPITFNIFNDGLHPDDRIATKRAIENALNGHNQGELRIQYRVINKVDQSVRWVEATGKTIFENGKPVRMVGTVQDISDRIEAQRKLAFSEQKLRMAMQTNRFGSFEFFNQHEQTEWDDLLKELWGISRDETPTQDIFWEGIHQDDVAMVREKLNKAADPTGDGHYYAVYRVINRLNGKLFWVEASGQTLFQDNLPIKMVGMIIDITERKELENSLQKAVHELTNADRQKNDFLAILGHELRNPLTALKAAIEILKKNTDPSAGQQLFPIMERSLGSMTKLLDDLLDLNRISLNEIKLEQQTVNLAEVLDYAVSIARNLLEEKGQEIKTHIPKYIFVKGDPTRLEQIFSNLLVNASKYTPRGGAVTLTAVAQMGTIKVTIRDNGVGIAPDILEKIFDPFFQVKHDNHAASGLGIGLALTRQLVELHQGTVWAESEGIGKGASFIITLPESLERSTHLKNRSIQQFAVRPGLRVLLIEDNEDILFMMPLVLEPLQCDIQTAGNGKAGLELAKTFQPEAILIDLGLPDIDGFSVAEKLRADGYQGCLVALSGYGHQEAKEKAARVGFDHHLAKPADIVDIAAIFANIT